MDSEFICPECGSKEIGELMMVSKESFTEKSKDPWASVLQQMECASCKKIIPALRLLKYDTLGFNLINGSKEVVSDSFDEAMFNTKSDTLPLLLKAWKAYEEKALLEKKKN